METIANVFYPITLKNDEAMKALHILEKLSLLSARKSFQNPSFPLWIAKKIMAYQRLYSLDERAGRVAHLTDKSACPERLPKGFL